MTNTTPPTSEPHLLITRKQAQQLLDYLKKQPYEQVHVLIDSIVRAPAANIVPEAPAE